MAYQTYTTPAIVCGSFASNTADKSYLLFTRDAGMLFASARSVREEKSRQRYALQDFSLINVSLVKGKAGWRVGSVESLRNYFLESANRAARASVYRHMRLLGRYIQGEVVDGPLYTEVQQQLDLLATPTLSNRPQAEQVVHLRLLYALGYISRTSALNKLIDAPLCEALPALTPATARYVAAAISQADTVSHL